MTKTKIILIIILFFASFLAALKFTRSYFSDTEAVLGNSIQVGVWGVTPTETPSPEAPTPTLTPTNTPTPTPTPTSMTDKVVINEVYYDVGTGRGSETSPTNDEWVELYNNTDRPVNIMDWTITDNTSTTTIHTNVDVPAFGFSLLAKDANTWTYWSIPLGVEKISLGQEIGNGLANTGDRLILKNKLGNVVDQMSYGSDTTYFFLTPVHDGHSWERNPDGLDTDTAADFIDQTNPSPGS